MRLQDYRLCKGAFDNIVSIEMFEAVGEHYWPAYFATVKERLKRGGRAIIQTITIKDELFAGYRTRSDFVRHYVFPGGMLPSLARFREEAEQAGLKFAGAFGFGKDYARTLREWLVRMQAKEAEIRALGHDTQFLRNWEFYLGICAATFEVARTDVVQVELVNAYPPLEGFTQTRPQSSASHQTATAPPAGCGSRRRTGAWRPRYACARWIR